MRNYLLKIKNGYLLIDTSWPRNYNSFKRKLKRKHIQITDITYLLITHSHTDHTGFAEKLLSESGAKLIVHEDTLPLLRKGEMESEAKPTNRIMRFMFRIAHKIIKATYPKITIADEKVLKIMKNKETIIPAEIGLTGKIIATPGHTHDSISLILENGKCFTGDLCSNNPWFVLMGLGRNPPLTIGRDYVLKSWEKLTINKVKIICPAHGKPFPIEKLEF